MESLSEAVNGWKRDCHHVFDVQRIFYDAPQKVYHFEVKCSKCGYIRRSLDLTEQTLEWNLKHPVTWTGWYGGAK